MPQLCQKLSQYSSLFSPSSVAVDLAATGGVLQQPDGRILSMSAPHISRISPRETLIAETLISLPVEVLMLVAGCLDARCLASFAGAPASTS